MQRERRKNQPRIPQDYLTYLNDDQITSLRRFEAFGWRLDLLRHPLFLDTEVILKSPDGKSTALLDADGMLIKSHNIPFRTGLPGN